MNKKNLSADTLLLSTKLKIPAPRKNYVVRQVLFEKLAQCGEMGVIFIRGGAGTGKTTLLSSFLRETGLKNVSWLSLDASNANVYSFWLYFTAAISVFWDDGDSFLELMRSNPNASNMENLLIMLINRLCGEEDYYLVLDDVHCIKDMALIHTLEFFIKAMPANFHLFMLSREDPPLYLGSLAVTGRLLFIDSNQMQLSPQEGMAFLRNTLKLDGSDEELNRLTTYAEGWIGGLQLAAAAGTVGGISGQLLRAGVGIAAEYLNREIFESLTARERDFLLKTGFLAYFNTEVSSILFDGFTQSDFNQMLNRLVRKNLFIICVDEKKGIYRYHNILSDYLAQQFALLPENQRKTLTIAAGNAFEQYQDFEEALRQYCDAEDYEDVLRVAEGMQGRIEAWSYLDKVPLERLILNADLAAQVFMYNLGIFNMEKFRELFDLFQKHYGDRDIFGIAQYAQAYLSQEKGTLPQYRVFTVEQVEKLPLGGIAKAMILVENAAALVEYMRYEEAEDCIHRAIEVNGGVNVFIDLFAYNELAQVYEETGRLNDSLACYARNKKINKTPTMLSGIDTNYYFGLAGIYMRRMELVAAGEMLEKARALLDSHHTQPEIAVATNAYHLAEMKFLTGQNEAGAAYVNELLSSYPTYHVLTLGRLIHELDCADLLPADMADNFLKELQKAENYKEQPFIRLLKTRLLFKKGKCEEAFREIDEVLTFSRIHRNLLRLVEADILKVFMLVQSADEPVEVDKRREIQNLLREALHYACENRILMPFYLDRITLLPLLLDLQKRSIGKDAMLDTEAAFLRDVVAVCSHSPIEGQDVELLSAREIEVLNEMALGITNREIAEKLCISIATVKTHVLNIFNKLEVSSRMLAVHEGRKRGLI